MSGCRLAEIPPKITASCALLVSKGGMEKKLVTASSRASSSRFEILGHLEEEGPTEAIDVISIVNAVASRGVECSLRRSGLHNSGWPTLVRIQCPVRVAFATSSFRVGDACVREDRAPPAGSSRSRNRGGGAWLLSVGGGIILNRSEVMRPLGRRCQVDSQTDKETVSCTVPGARG